MRREFREQTSSLDELVSALQTVSPGAQLDVKQPKHFRWRVRFLGTPDLQVWRGEGNADWTCAAKETVERVTLIVPVLGAVQSVLRRKTYSSAGTHGLVFSDPDPVLVSGHGRPDNVQINIKWKPSALREVLRRVYELEGPPVLPDPRFDLRSKEGQLFHLLARGLAAGHFEEISGSPSASALLSETMLRLLLEGSQLSSDAIFTRLPAAASSRQVRAAIELMYDKLHEPLTLGSIAELLGISGRSLQKGFRRYHDTTPLTYLRNLRLEAVHRELSNPQNNLSVGDVASKWGFAHVGRLAKLYRTSYGLSPSETVQRAQKRR